MSTLNFNVAALDLSSMLNIELANGWSEDLMHELSTVCYCSNKVELGFIVVVTITDGNYSFQVAEYADHHDGDFSQTEDCKTMEEALTFIRERANLWMHGNDNF